VDTIPVARIAVGRVSGAASQVICFLDRDANESNQSGINPNFFVGEPLTEGAQSLPGRAHQTRHYLCSLGGGVKGFRQFAKEGDDRRFDEGLNCISGRGCLLNVNFAR
jgi:hypothetical protein